MHNMKNVFQQFAVVLAIAVLTSLVITGVLALTGNFSPDTDGGFGLYNSSWDGLESRYNPMRDFIWALEIFTFILLPLVLFALRKYVKVYIRPWLVVSMILLFQSKLWPFFPEYLDKIDPTVSSNMSFFLHSQYCFVATLFIGLAILDYQVCKEVADEAGAAKIA